MIRAAHGLLLALHQVRVLGVPESLTAEAAHARASETAYQYARAAFREATPRAALGLHVRTICSSCGTPGWEEEVRDPRTCAGCQAYVARVRQWLKTRRFAFIYGDGRR